MSSASNACYAHPVRRKDRLATAARIKSLAADVAEEHGLEMQEMMFGKRPVCVEARHQLFSECRRLNRQPSYQLIADTLGFQRETVRAGVWRYRSGKAYVAKERPLCQRCGKRVRSDGFCSARCKFGV